MSNERLCNAMSGEDIDSSSYSLGHVLSIAFQHAAFLPNDKPQRSYGGQLIMFLYQELLDINGEA